MHLSISDYKHFPMCACNLKSTSTLEEGSGDETILASSVTFSKWPFIPQIPFVWVYVILQVSIPSLLRNNEHIELIFFGKFPTIFPLFATFTANGLCTFPISLWQRSSSSRTGVHLSLYIGEILSCRTEENCTSGIVVIDH